MDFKLVLKCVGERRLSESELLQANGKRLRGQRLNEGIERRPPSTDEA